MAGAAAPGGDRVAEQPPSSDPSAAARAVAEADVIQVAGGKLYALSRTGTLSIVDVSRPRTLALLGQLALPGEPFEMYLREGTLVVMVNGAYGTGGELREPEIDSTGRAIAQPSVAADPASGAAVLTVDITRPEAMARRGAFAVPGEIADSRIVGDVLYLVTYQNASCYRCGAVKQTVVSTFDVAEPTAMRQVSMISYADRNVAGSSASFTDGWKRSVYATATRLYVGGHADGPPSYSFAGPGEGVIDVLDISDKAGQLVPKGRISTAGAVLSRWQMDEKDGVLRVVSQRGIGYMRNGLGSPWIETFTASGDFPVKSAVPIKLPRQEALKTVRFDGDRAYAITFAETDPLFILDLSGAEPKQRGELVMPGWVFHIEPFGDRLLGLGVDRRSYEGHLNVSLFDVADMDQPKMLERVSFGNYGHATDKQILAYEMPEDQDRIQKAFRVLEDGLIVVPYSNGAASADLCNLAGGVQLVSWESDRLVKKSSLELTGAPRRAVMNGPELLAVSDANVTSWDIASLDTPALNAQVGIGDCSNVTSQVAFAQPPRDYGHGYYEGGHGFYCSFGSASSAAPGALLPLALTGLLVGVVRRRRRNA